MHLLRDAPLIFRKYGKTPYKVAVIHGGPGARGEMAPVAKELSKICGLLEPLQTATTIKGQTKELHSVLRKYATLPVILIGHSWGAWLSFIFTAQYPRMVKKLILVSSGPFQEKYVSSIMKTRLARLNSKQKRELEIYLKLINNQLIDKNLLQGLVKQTKHGLEFTKFGQLISATDSYQPMKTKTVVDFRLDIMQKVWRQAELMRRTGQLLNPAKNIRCPVLATHGNYDPHPAQGVKMPLSRTLKDFKFILLKHCGHTPWLERQAHNDFYKILKNEISFSLD